MTTFIRVAVIACGLLGLLAPVAAQAPAPADTSSVTKYLLSRLHPGNTRDMFIRGLKHDFAFVDADRNGEANAADLEIHKAMVGQTNEQAYYFLMAAVRADLNDDGVVTEEELRRRLTYDERLRNSGPPHPRMLDHEVRQFLAADANGDGKVSFAEAKAHGDKLPAQGHKGNPRQLLPQLLAMMGKSSLTLEDLESLAAPFFAVVDTDKNNTASKEEIDAYRGVGGQPTIAQEAVERNKKQIEQMRGHRLAEQEAQLRAACAMPKASDRAKLLVLSAYEADALSTVAVGSQDMEVRTGTVEVERGDDPLYVVIAAHRAVIWRFTGAVDRVERVVLASVSNTVNGSEQDAVSAVGLTGIPAARATFLKAKCLGYFSEAQSTDAAKAVGLIRKQLEREPAVVAARSTVSGFMLPSGEIRATGRRDQKPTPLIINGETIIFLQPGVANLTRDLERHYPGGVVEIDPASVVASKPVERYEVLPGQAGLLQLVQSGAITRNQSREFLIRQKIRFPAGLHGANSTKFLLLRGVPEPDGDPGHSCVIVEETGEPLKSSISGICR